jgi:hypothetical protein
MLLFSAAQKATSVPLGTSGGCRAEQPFSSAKVGAIARGKETADRRQPKVCLKGDYRLRQLNIWGRRPLEPLGDDPYRPAERASSRSVPDDHLEAERCPPKIVFAKDRRYTSLSHSLWHGRPLDLTRDGQHSAKREFRPADDVISDLPFA